MRVVIVGAGTGVGKTHVACALASALVRRGVSLVARKPIESGYDEPVSDASALARAAGHSTIAPTFALAEPVSPHRAARRSGCSIRLEPIVESMRCDPATLVECAGGLLSPLSLELTNLDLATALEPDAVVLVVANRLGALHDVRACTLALASRGLGDRLIVALSAPAERDLATAHNAEELTMLGWAPSVVEFPRAPLGDATTRAAADSLASRLGT
jgi:dethiobiotin synthetase